jgi:hypothetical protein
MQSHFTNNASTPNVSMIHCGMNEAAHAAIVIAETDTVLKISSISFAVFVLANIHISPFFLK